MSNELNRESFHQYLREAESVCILGHVSPDGDCLGSTLALYNYIRAWKALEEADSDVRVQVYLEDSLNEKFSFLNGFSEISHEKKEKVRYDLCIVCDCADMSRFSDYMMYYEEAKVRLLIDHHFTNKGFGDAMVVRAEASSASELVYELLDPDVITRETAECVYTGIVHDTGVFHHSCTSKRTMEIAGECIEKGIPFTKIIDESFNAMRFSQKLALGDLLSRLKSRMDGLLVYGWLDLETKERFGLESKDMDGYVDLIRSTQGAKVGVFMYETPDKRVKVSLRANSDDVDVSAIAACYNGGGHIKAAGCFMTKDFEKNIDLIEEMLRAQLGMAEK